jgi:hypothetical protein
MPADRVTLHAERPTDLSDFAIITFGPDYGADHPLWLADGLADLDGLHLDPHLATRLAQWSEHWEAHFRWETDDWPAGQPERWWLEEGDRLPTEVAAALGSEFAVGGLAGGYLRSGAPPDQPEAAAVMREYVRAGEALRREIAANPGRYRYTFEAD